MKKPSKIILYLLLVLPILFIGCQKSELRDDSAAGSVKSEQVILPYTPCGKQLVANLYEYGNTGISYGTVTIGNDATNLYINFQTSGSYMMRNTALFVGLAADLPPGGLPPTPSFINNDGTGSFHPGSFPYKYAPGPPAPAYQKIIPLSSVPDCFIIVAFAEIPVPTAADPKRYILVSAKAPTAFKSSGYYLDYCKQKCTAPTCETAYAYGNSWSTCFLSIPGVTSNNWGWTNKITGPVATIHWPIYAGAGQCKITKGKLVGYLDGSYSAGVLKLKYNINFGYTLNETHLYVGTNQLPLKNGKLTTAPGQFPYSGPTFEKSITAPFYIAAHSVVCGSY